MKKLLLLALTTMVMVGCAEPVTIDINKEDLKIVTIDSCEYIKCYTYGFNSYVYSHKGNCKYCAERHKQELKELVEQLKNK